MKKCFVVIGIMICNIACMAFSNNFSVPKEYMGLQLRKAFKGNYTNSGKNEFLCFYSSAKNNEPEPVYDKVVVYVVKNNDVVEQYEMSVEVSFEYNDYELRKIRKLEPIFGKWNGFFYQYDLNGNGKKELFFFEYGGLGLVVYVYEFINGEFVSVADTMNCTNVSMTVDVEQKSFRLSSPYEPEDTKKGLNSTTFVWNSKKGKYEIKK